MNAREEARLRVKERILAACAEQLATLLTDNIHKAFRSESKTVDLEDFQDDVRELVREFAFELEVIATTSP